METEKKETDGKERKPDHVTLEVQNIKVDFKSRVSGKDKEDLGHGQKST